jgi:flagellar hook-associated protein 2
LSIMRIGGLASGMDIDQIIADMMSVRRLPLDKLTQQRQRLEWQQEDYRAINKQLFSLRESVFSLKLQGTFNVKSAFSSNEDIVQVSAGGNALNGTYKIAVKQLAEGAFKTSSAPLGSTDDYSTLSTQLEGLKGEIKFSINDQEFTVNTETESIYDLMNKINKADIGVQASYDRNLDRFFLSTTGTGENAQIEIVGGAYQSEEGEKNFFEDILNIDTGVVKGKNAEFTLNGAEFTMASNEFTINGISYSLKGLSPTGADGEPVAASVSVKSDTEKIFDTIMDFVNLYNETIDKINGKLFEKYYRDYPPLTDAMREQLDDDQIEKWMEKARSGLLRNDSMLSGIVSQMRTAIYGVVEGVSGEYNSLASIWITTGDYSERGKLHVNEDKLREAIAKDPEGIKELFTATSADGSSKNEGIASRLYNEVVAGISKVTEKAGIESEFSLVDESVIGKRIKDMDDRIEDYEDRLKMIEDRYWRQFTAMEKAINQMNSQSMWLMQQFSMGKG